MKQIIRYFFSALIATVVDVGVYYIALLVLDIPVETLRITVANTIGFIFGFTTNFVISRIWVFKEKPKMGFVSELIFIVIISLIGFWINNSVVLYFSQTNKVFQPLADFISAYLPIPEILNLIAKCVAIVITFVWNYIARRIIVYRK